MEARSGGFFLRVVVAIYSLHAAAGVAAAQVSQVGTLDLGSATASAVVIDQARAKVYVADQAGGTVKVFNESTQQLLTTINVCYGILANDMFVIDQSRGKIYAGCGKYL